MSCIDRDSAPETGLPNVIAAKLGLRLHERNSRGAMMSSLRTSKAPQAEGVDRAHTEGIGTLPKRDNTVRATVLARLLKGEQQLTAMDGVFDASTTRLASDVHVLRHKFGWGAITDAVQVPTADGRIADVARYSLSAAVIAAAKASGADIFVQAAKEAHAARRCRLVAGPKMTQELQ